MKKAMITGGCGFIGSNLTQRLVSEGWAVDVVDNLSSGMHEFLDPGVQNFFEYDFAHEDVELLIKKQKYDCVFHLAAKPRVAYSVEKPVESNDENVSKTLQLLDYCKYNVKRFINTSSSSVFGTLVEYKDSKGNEQVFPANVNGRHAPTSPYALQKSITEQYCRLYKKLYGLETVSIRPFNVFGPNQTGDNPYALAVSSWLHAVKHGGHLRSDGDGSQTRDMTYVSNVVDVFEACANFCGHFDCNGVGDVFNAGTGMRVSNNEILSWFKREFPECLVKHAPERIGDVKHTLADITHTTKILGYTPKIGFWTGLQMTKSWAMNSSLF